jgi:hypothetical protein
MEQERTRLEWQPGDSLGVNPKCKNMVEGDGNCFGTESMKLCYSKIMWSARAAILRHGQVVESSPE